MHACLSAWVCTYAIGMYTCKYVYKQTYMSQYVYAYINVCIYGYMYVCRQIYMYVSTYTYYLHPYIHTCVWAYAYINTFTLEDMHGHICVHE